MKIRAIQFGPKLGDVAHNLKVHSDHIIKAVEEEIELIIFPELSISGYQLRDLVYDISIRPNDNTIKTFLEMSKNIDIIIGAPYEEMAGVFYNAALYFSEGNLRHIHRKNQLPNFGMFEERMIFHDGCGFKTFQIGEFKAGIVICREILFPINAYLYHLQNVDFLVGISNSPTRGMNNEGFSSLKLWERLGEVFAINFHQNYVFVNRTGFEDGMGFGGGSFFACAGRGLTQKAKYLEDDVLDFQISIQDVRRSKISANYSRDENPELVLKELNRIVHA